MSANLRILEAAPLMKNRTSGAMDLYIKWSFLAILFYCVIKYAIYIHYEAFSLDYNEGVYLESAISLNKSHRLYQEVFGSQPPLFFETLKGVLAISPKIVAARWLICGFSLLSILVVGLITHQLRNCGGVFIACYSVVAFSTFRESFLTIQAEMPSMAFALMSISIAAWGGCRMRNVKFAFLTGGCFAMGALYKLLIAPMMPVLLAVPFLCAKSRQQCFDLPTGDGANPSDRLDDSIFSDWLRYVCWLMLGFAVSTVLVLTQYDIFGWQKEAVKFHLTGLSIMTNPLEANWKLLAAILKENLGLILLAITGAFALFKTDKWIFSLMIIWISFSAAFSIVHSPLLKQHLILFAAPIAILVAGNEVWLRRLPGEIQKGALLSLILLIPLFGINSRTVSHWPRLTFLPLVEHSEDARNIKQYIVTAIVARYSESTDYVVTDNQMEAFRAGRKIPVELVDTSYVRIAAASLTENECISVCKRFKPKLVVFSSGRFNRLNGFKKWVKHNYTLLTSIQGIEIYIHTKNSYLQNKVYE